MALSLFIRSRDSRAARLVKDLTDPRNEPTIRDEELPARLAACLAIPPSERAARVSEAMRLARTHLSRRERHGLDTLTVRDAGYPEWLGHIDDPPIVLWTRGAQSHLRTPAVAIVGSRDATPTAVKIAREMARELSEEGLVIVSGMARGVDAAAHEGALDAKAPTVAVLGSGADVIYPRDHRALAARIAATGLIVSEFAPGTPPRAGHFPLRNRIISGLAQAVVVVEASEKSGSLITARLAAEQGRDVLAVPGNVLSGLSRGCHALIRDGAAIVENASDVLTCLGRWHSCHRKRSDSTNSLQLNELGGRMARGEPYSVEDLAQMTSRPASALLADLGALELAGQVVRIAGGRYVKLD